jgi:hypothetical protein
MPGDSSGIICGSDIKQLVELFLQFEGASDPLAAPCKEAKQAFNALIERLHAEKVSVHPDFKSINLVQFRAYARQKCRLVAISNSKPFLSCF